MRKHLMMCASLGAVAISSAASAAPAVFYDTVTAGPTQFSNVVTGAGGTVNTQLLANGQSVYTDFSIAGTPTDTYALIPGSNVVINPAGSGVNPNNYRGSGTTFTFNGAVNAFGLYVGDWGTCCLPSALFIAFDGGAPIQVANATFGTPALLSSGVHSVFVGAIDTSNKFTSVTFWGNGVGEYLVAGGSVHYSNLKIGSVNPGVVPEPSTWMLMILGFGLIAQQLRRRHQAGTPVAA